MRTSRWKIATDDADFEPYLSGMPQLTVQLFRRFFSLARSCGPVTFALQRRRGILCCYPPLSRGTDSFRQRARGHTEECRQDLDRGGSYRHHWVPAARRWSLRQHVGRYCPGRSCRRTTSSVRSPSPPTERWGWSCLVSCRAVCGMGLAAAYGDVAVACAGAYLDHLVARFGMLGGVEAVVQVAVVRVQIQPGSDAGADTDLELAEAGLDYDRTTRDLTEADVAVGGLGLD